MALTDEQIDAINEKDKTLLVSAAAGAGKTLTLRKRIIESIKDGADISRMLIVTFTRATAKELRTKIGETIKEALKNDPKNKHLSDQLLCLPFASISTIDGFCNDIIRQNKSKIGLGSGFRICDATEHKLLSKEILDEIIDEGFEKGIEGVCTKAEFIYICDTVTGSGNPEDTADRLLSLYYKTEGIPDRIKYLRDFRDSFCMDFDKSPFYSVIAWHTCALLAFYKKIYESILPEMFGDKKADAAAENMRKEIACFDNAIAASHVGYEALSEAMKFTLESLPGGRTQCEAYDAYKDYHKDLDDKIGKIKILFNYQDFEICEAKEKYLLFYNFLISVFERFEERLAKEKKQRGMLTFSDIELYTYRLLVDGEGNPTALAMSIRDTYDYVYIDEYQDVNYIQDKIFESVSRADNRFMVGDIKQSIYGFRGGKPDIFAKMKNEYPIYYKGIESDRAKIFMSANFRCDESIVDATNAVFDLCFKYAGKSIGYTDADKLIYKKTEKTEKAYVEAKTREHKCEVHLFSRKAKAESGEETDPAEAEFIASEIERLLNEETADDGKKLKPSDIAILVRSTTHTDNLIAALEKRRILVSCEAKTDFFATPDAQIVLSVLHAIDNPHSDTYLCGAMHSGVFNFTLDELAKIRLENKNSEDFYAALLAYNEEHDFKKGKDFVSLMNALREYSRGASADKLISRLYSLTDILYSVENRDTCMLIFDFARGFEASSYKGLYNFLSYVDAVASAGKSEQPTLEAEKGGVIITTLHKAKGLDYQAVFVSGAGAYYSDREYKGASVIFDNRLGYGVKFLDSEKIAYINNPVNLATLLEYKRSQAEEEMRMLYVAMTRAKHRLYITATPERAKPDTLIKNAERYVDSLDEYALLSQNTYISLVLLALKKQSDKFLFFAYDEFGNCANGKDVRPPFETTEKESTITEQKEDEPLVLDEKTAKRIAENLDFVYDYSAFSKVPGKLSVSKLSPSVLDGTEEDEDVTADEAEDTEEEKHLPVFYSGIKKNNSAEKGSATHLFLQFADFERAIKTGTRAELELLLKNKFITKEEKDLVRVGELDTFLKSPLLAEMLKAKNIWRELRFNAKLPCENFTEDEVLKEKLKGADLLVQGVIDCVFMKQNGDIVLLDYKTDRTEAFGADAEKMLCERHRAQLKTYKDVCTAMFGRAPTKVVIYSLSLGREVPIDV